MLDACFEVPGSDVAEVIVTLDNKKEIRIDYVHQPIQNVDDAPIEVRGNA